MKQTLTDSTAQSRQAQHYRDLPGVFAGVRSQTSVTHRGGSHVFASIWYLGLVGIVGTADHRAGGGEAVAPHHAATGLA